MTWRNWLILFWTKSTIWIATCCWATRLTLSFRLRWQPASSAASRGSFFLQETSHAGYVDRLRAINKTDYINQLPKINVPTLILTPEEDRVVCKETAGIMLRGIQGSREVVLPRAPGTCFGSLTQGSIQVTLRHSLRRFRKTFADRFLSRQRSALHYAKP
jgi:pimeloyl-ACP methyl ester carboxylesterase